MLESLEWIGKSEFPGQCARWIDCEPLDSLTVWGTVTSARDICVKSVKIRVMEWALNGGSPARAGRRRGLILKSLLKGRIDQFGEVFKPLNPDSEEGTTKSTEQHEMRSPARISSFDPLMKQARHGSKAFREILWVPWFLLLFLD